MPSVKLWRTKLARMVQKTLIFLLIFAWFFSGWPQILSFAEEATPTPAIATPTPEIATPTPETATSTPETATSTATSSPEAATSTLEVSTPTPTPAESLSATSTLDSLMPTPEPQSEPQVAGESFEEEEAVQGEISNPAPELPPLPPSPPLKVRQLERQVVLDKNASHQCQAVNFSINISNKNPTIVELALVGKRDSAENLEIGSLPLGIDITFLNNANYSYSPAKSDNVAVLHITNQPGSQKGNFSVPIIYQSGNSTTICQINVINF